MKFWKYKDDFSNFDYERIKSEKDVKKYMKSYLKFYGYYGIDRASYLNTFATYAKEDVKIDIIMHSNINDYDKQVLFKSLSKNGKDEVLLKIAYSNYDMYKNIVPINCDYVPSHIVILKYTINYNLDYLLIRFHLDSSAYNSIFLLFKRIDFKMIEHTLVTFKRFNIKFDTDQIHNLVLATIRKEVSKDDYEFIYRIYYLISKLCNDFVDFTNIKKIVLPPEIDDIYLICYYAYLKDNVSISMCSGTVKRIINYSWKFPSKLFYDFINNQKDNLDDIDFYNIVKYARFGCNSLNDYELDNYYPYTNDNENITMYSFIPDNVLLKIVKDEADKLDSYFKDVTSSNELFIKQYGDYGYRKDINNIPNKLSFYIQLLVDRKLNEKLDKKYIKLIMDICINFYKTGIDKDAYYYPFEWSAITLYKDNRLINFATEVSKQENDFSITEYIVEYAQNGGKFNNDELYLLFKNSNLEWDIIDEDDVSIIDEDVIIRLAKEELDNPDGINFDKMEYYAKYFILKNTKLDSKLYYQIMNYLMSTKFDTTVVEFMELCTFDKKILDLFSNWFIKKMNDENRFVYIERLYKSEIKYIDDENVINITYAIINHMMVINNDYHMFGFINYLKFIDKVSNVSILKDLFLRINSMYLIACYIYVSRDEKLLTKYFGDKDRLRTYLQNTDPTLKEFSFDKQPSDGAISAIKRYLDDEKVSGVIKAL